jgi:hypothetical protein
MGVDGGKRQEFRKKSKGLGVLGMGRKGKHGEES